VRRQRQTVGRQEFCQESRACRAFEALHRACDDVLDDDAGLSVNQDARLSNAGGLDHGSQ
jgi:hypothetical protein